MDKDIQTQLYDPSLCKKGKTPYTLSITELWKNTKLANDYKEGSDASYLIGKHYLTWHNNKLMLHELIEIPIKNIVTTKEEMKYKEPIYKELKTQAPPVDVVEVSKGKYKLYNGHRRLKSAIARGDKCIFSEIVSEYNMERQYDPKKRKGSYIAFVKKNMKAFIQKYGSAKKAMKMLGKAWRMRKTRRYDPHRLIESPEEGGRELPEGKDHYHSHFKIYDTSKLKRYIITYNYPGESRRTTEVYARNKKIATGQLTRTDAIIHEVKELLYDPAPRRRTRGHLESRASFMKALTRPPRRWFYAMLQGINKRSDVRNPAAIVGDIWKRLSRSKKLEIKRRELAGKPFKYDLPLPDDKATHGTGTLRMVKPFKLTEVQVNITPRDYLSALRSGLFHKMKRNDGTIALVSRCKSQKGNCNIFVDKAGK